MTSLFTITCDDCGESRYVANERPRLSLCAECAAERQKQSGRRRRRKGPISEARGWNEPRLVDPAWSHRPTTTTPTTP
jgi:hypothetical protein